MKERPELPLIFSNEVHILRFFRNEVEVNTPVRIVNSLTLHIGSHTLPRRLSSLSVRCHADRIVCILGLILSSFIKLSLFPDSILLRVDSHFVLNSAMFSKILSCSCPWHCSMSSAVLGWRQSWPSFLIRIFRLISWIYSLSFTLAGPLTLYIICVVIRIRNKVTSWCCHVRRPAHLRFISWNWMTPRPGIRFHLSQLTWWSCSIYETLEPWSMSAVAETTSTWALDDGLSTPLLLFRGWSDWQFRKSDIHFIESLLPEVKNMVVVPL